MEWDGGTIWRIALGIFFVLCGAGAAYALFRLGSALKRAADILGSVDSEMLPILTRVETTLDEVNAELSKIEKITGSIAEILKVVEKTTTALHSLFAVPLRKLGDLFGGVGTSAKSFVASKKKGET